VLVAQTDVTGIWAVPRRRRYRVYLAGMAWDLALLARVLIALAYVPMAGTLEALARPLAVLLVLGLVGQLQLYMRTDVYYTLADLLYARNLTEDAGAYVGSLARRALRRLARGAGHTAVRPDVLAALSPRERRAVRLYAPVMIIGSAVALALYARYGVPVLVELFASAADSVWIGATEGVATRLIDGALTLDVEGGLQVLFVWVLLRNRGERVRGVWRRVATA
jgi:putative peptide zinc metalloprotease protein